MDNKDQDTGLFKYGPPKGVPPPFPTENVFTSTGANNVCFTGLSSTQRFIVDENTEQ